MIASAITKVNYLILHFHMHFPDLCKIHLLDLAVIGHIPVYFDLYVRSLGVNGCRETSIDARFQLFFE